MSEELWKSVEEFLVSSVLEDDPALDAAVAASDAAGLPHIQVSPLEGKLLYLIARLRGAKRVLEVGTLAGYSTIWLGRALPKDGGVVTLELKPEHAQVARQNFERAGLAHLMDLRVGAAAESLAQLVKEKAGPFDLTFIDADKRSTPEYFERALELSRPGSVIIVDNIVRDGKVAADEKDDPDNQGMRRFLERIAHDLRVSATVIPTAGSKGYDGFALLIVN